MIPLLLLLLDSSSDSKEAKRKCIIDDYLESRGISNVSIHLVLFFVIFFYVILGVTIISLSIYICYIKSDYKLKVENLELELGETQSINNFEEKQNPYKADSQEPIQLY